MDFKKVLKGWK
jgi:hypothetical protein